MMYRLSACCLDFMCPSCFGNSLGASEACGSLSGLSLTLLQSCSTNAPGAVETCGTTLVNCSKGTCQDSVAGNYCLCPSNLGFTYVGRYCELPVCPSACGGSARGNCTNGPTQQAPPFCSCIQPYSGSRCENVTCNPACVNGACVGQGLKKMDVYCGGFCVVCG